MKTKVDVYSEHLQNMVEKIARICESYEIPMVMAFCLNNDDLGDGRMQMTVAGTTHLKPEESPPEPMVIAASLIRIPGFKEIDFEFEEID